MNQIAVRKSNLEIELDNYEPQFAAALPSHISVDKFKRVVVTAINRNPDLYTKADRRSLFLACTQCASDGLIPDGREAALVIYGGKVQYLPMVQGILRRMRNSGEVASVDAQAVYQNDKFSYRLGDHAEIVHEPTLGDPGNLIGVYAIIKLTNGEVIREVMNRAAIEKVRSVSRSKDRGPWVDWYPEMARKSVIRRAAKRAPTTPDLERILSRDVDHEDAPALPVPPRPTRQSIAAPTEFAEAEESPIDPAAAGHEDLDARFRATTAETVDADGEIHDTATEAPTEAPNEKGQKEGLTEPGGVTPGSAEPYDAAREFDALWKGAQDQDNAAALSEYWRIQRQPEAAAEVLYRKAPDLYQDLQNKIQTLYKTLKLPTPAAG